MFTSVAILAIVLCCCKGMRSFELSGKYIDHECIPLSIHSTGAISSSPYISQTGLKSIVNNLRAGVISYPQLQPLLADAVILGIPATPLEVAENYSDTNLLTCRAESKVGIIVVIDICPKMYMKRLT